MSLVTTFCPFTVETELVTPDQFDRSAVDSNKRLVSVLGHEQTRFVLVLVVESGGGA